jgi:hypothetical protein
LAEQEIKNLREFIQARFPQYLSYAGYPRVILDFEVWPL